MPYDLLTLEKHDRVALVTLNRPEKRNALSIALREEIDRCLQELEADDTVSVVVITGAGPVFCAGFDTSEFVPDKLEAVEASSNRYHRRLAEFSKPLVAAVNGPAMGGGLDLAVLCDLRIAAEGAAFAHPEIRFGAPVLFGPLREIIGGGLARELCLTARRIDAQEALRIGLVNRVVPGDRLLDEALAVANDIAQAPLPALSATKRMIIGTYTWQLGDGPGFFAATQPPAR
ncbi:MAG: enoyl-CoA hydratase/isomerase family protein [Armatimonadota bacterium]|nr:enoyl-CoA hydratase/isomerase family protein [Armatimonadota bacterium]